MHKDKTFECNTCGKNYKNHEYLQKHKKRVHHGESQKAKRFMIALKCQFCEVEFASKKSLDRHLNYLRSKKGDNYECDICKKIFNDKIYLMYISVLILNEYRIFD